MGLPDYSPDSPVTPWERQPHRSFSALGWIFTHSSNTMLTRGGERETDDPAPAGVLCQLMQEETGPDRELLSLRTDADGKLEGVSFDAQAGRTFYLKVVFEMEDSSIHLKRSRFSTVPLVPPLLMW